ALDASMTIERSADESHRRGARTIPPQALLTRGYDFGVVGKAQVIVGAEDDDRLGDSVEADGRIHRTSDVAQALVLSCLLQGLKQFARSCVEVGHRYCDSGIFSTTLIASPLCISFTPLSNWSI